MSENMPHPFQLGWKNPASYTTPLTLGAYISLEQSVFLRN